MNITSNIIAIEKNREKTIPIFRNYPVNKAILFGAFAKGEANNTSDIDLYIDTNGKLRKYRRQYMEQDKIIEQEMYKKAIEFIPRRYPKGWGGVAVIRSKTGNYFISVPIETANSSVDLCIEVGAICEAHKYNERVTHCLCVVRDNENCPFKILSPCGVCQERLRFWGGDVRVGVTTLEKNLKFISLNELQPYHWTNAYPPEELEQYKGQ